MNGRIYDGLLGRFLSADLIVQNPGSLQSFNRYSYCGNNPLTLTDPSGFTAETDEQRKAREAAESGARSAAIGQLGILGYIGGGDALQQVISQIGSIAVTSAANAALAAATPAPEGTPDITAKSGAAVSPVAPTDELRAQCLSAARGLLKDVRDDPANRDVAKALDKMKPSFRFSAGTRRTVTNKITGKTTTTELRSGAGSYNPKTNRVGLILDPTAGPSPFLKSHASHEGVHVRDAARGKDIKGKDNIDSEVDAWERTIDLQMKDLGHTEVSSHQKLLRADGSVDRDFLRYVLSSDGSYKQGTGGNPETATTDEPIGPVFDFTYEELVPDKKRK